MLMPLKGTPMKAVLRLVDLKRGSRTSDLSCPYERRVVDANLLETMEAAKSTINVFYQRSNSLARPIYSSQSLTRAPPHPSCPSPFVCVLTLPAIHAPTISDRLALDMPEASFQGTGPRKKDAEAAAASCALEWLQTQDAYAALMPQSLDSSLAATISRVLQYDKVSRCSGATGSAAC